MHIVWLKRDLRLHDHRALMAAETAARNARAPLLVLYVVEDSVWSQPTMSAKHWVFVRTALEELDQGLRQRGNRLVVLRGEMPTLLASLHARQLVQGLYSHRETGDAVTFARDRRVVDFCQSHGIPWVEFAQNGVVRRLKNRDGWSARWHGRMNEPLVNTPDRLAAAPTEITGCELPHAGVLGLEGSTEHIQVSGEAAAVKTLDSFLATRGEHYATEMSSPVTAWEACSRISPHLAWGTLSLRKAYQDTQSARQRYRAERVTGGFLRSLAAFQSRLRWHCHFMQKLEDEPEIEFENMSRAYDGMREGDFNEHWFRRWQEGTTGYPMVDACMRSLHETGWINFRMRAMLVSFASYHLWLHWKRPADFLARLFTDYEPGIHYSQFQMQSGVTGINAVRIYSPTKQVTDHDPKGVFIRWWLPELNNVPDDCLAEPLEAGLALDYPGPIVEHKEAYAHARRRVYAWRARPEVKAAAEEVYQKHGSRKRPRRPSQKR